MRWSCSSAASSASAASGRAGDRPPICSLSARTVIRMGAGRFDADVTCTIRPIVETMAG